MLTIRINICNNRTITVFYINRLKVEAPTLALYCVSKSTLEGFRLQWQKAGLRL